MLALYGVKETRGMPRGCLFCRVLKQPTVLLSLAMLPLVLSRTTWLRTAQCASSRDRFTLGELSCVVKGLELSELPTLTPKHPLCMDSPVPT